MRQWQHHRPYDTAAINGARLSQRKRRFAFAEKIGRVDHAYAQRAAERRKVMGARAARSQDEFRAVKRERDSNLRSAPEIETARLVLRAHRLNDLAACATMWADPAVTRYITGKPSTLQQTWSRLLTYVGHWALLGFGYWAVEEKLSGSFVGELGFAEFKRDLQPSLAGLPELGWAFVAHAHGRGYATEAVLAAQVWGDGNLEIARSICIVDPENTASIRVAQKCGYAESLRLEYGGKLVVVFDRIAPIIE